jgi:plastocyanin
MLWRATVQRENPAKPAGFSPQQQQAQAGDALFWFNEDEHEPHQPVPDSGSWNIPPIPARSSSAQLSLGNPGTFAYHCVNHPDEKASIVVANAVLIAAGANPLFGPLSITQGQCVSWGNSDSEAHQPCPDSGDAWFSEPVAPGDLSASIPFATSGTVSYHCALHPDNPAETGSIDVSAPTA